MLQMRENVILLQPLRQEIDRDQQADHYRQQVKRQVSRYSFFQAVHIRRTNDIPGPGAS